MSRISFNLPDDINKTVFKNMLAFAESPAFKQANKIAARYNTVFTPNYLKFAEDAEKYITSFNNISKSYDSLIDSVSSFRKLEIPELLCDSVILEECLTPYFAAAQYISSFSYEQSRSSDNSSEIEDAEKTILSYVKTAGELSQTLEPLKDYIDTTEDKLTVNKNIPPSELEKFELNCIRILQNFSNYPEKLLDDFLAQPPTEQVQYIINVIIVIFTILTYLNSIK